MPQNFLATDKPKSTIWYISKYLGKPSPQRRGSRGFYLLRELKQLGHEVVAFVSDSNHLIPSPPLENTILIENVEGVIFCWIKTAKYESARSMKRVISWFHFDLSLVRLPKQRFPRPDVIIASSLSITSIIPAYLLSRRYRARLIFEIRDIWPLTLIEEGGFSKFNPLILFLTFVEKFGYAKSDAIVGTMPNLIQHVQQVSNTKVPIFCIPMGIAESSFKSTQQLPTEYTDKKIPNDRFIVGYAGTVGKTNALETLFQSVYELRNETNIHFVVVGGGDLLCEFTSKYGFLHNLTIVGAVDQQYIQRILSEFDLVYLSTYSSKVWDFGQSLNKLIDYMYSGKPVIASYSGYPSMINEASSGIFLEAGNSKVLSTEILKMSRLGKIELEAMGQRGRSWILKNRQYSTLAKDYEKVIDIITCRSEKK